MNAKPNTSIETARDLEANSSVSKTVLVAYAAPAFSSQFLFAAVSLYLLKYSTDVLLMAPATMGHPLLRRLDLDEGVHAEFSDRIRDRRTSRIATPQTTSASSAASTSTPVPVATAQRTPSHVLYPNRSVAPWEKAS